MRRLRILDSAFAGATVIGIAALHPIPARAWVPHTASVAAVKVSTPPKLDGTMADPAWRKGVVFDNFYDFTNHRAAAQTTVGYLLYDDRNLYVAVHCRQAGIAITAVQNVDHAGVATDDHISLNLETSGSGARVYQFRANPHGIHDEYSSENSRYAPDWQSTATVSPNGDWSLVMVIPLRILRAQGGQKQNWQIDLVRFIAATNDEYTWAYDDTMQSVGSSQYWPHLTGLQIPASASRPKPRADAYVLGSAGPDRGIFQNGIGNFQPLHARPYGVDVTVPLTNTLAFVGTLNPDFSNVEEDQTTIAPQEFQRQYSEYRPFFAQGANYINVLPGTNINSSDIQFYSPSIGVFDRGLKIEGTQGLASIGLLNVIGDGFDDTAFGYSFSRPDNSLTLALDGVAANHTGLRDDTFGYAAATTNPRNGVFALARITMDRGTNIENPAEANDFQLSAGMQNTHTLALVKYADIGPQYNPVDGYLQINDLRGPQAFYQYTGNGPKGSPIKSYQVLFGADRFVDRSGAAHQADLFSNASVTLKNLVTLQYGQTTSNLRSYSNAYPAYTGSQVIAFNNQNVSFGYRDGTPSPVDASYSWGPFANNSFQPIFLQQLSVSTSLQKGRFGVSFAYNGAIEHALPNSPAPPLDSQWLRSVALTRSFGKNASLAIGLREINGNGGYALPGANLALSYHQRFNNLDELYVDYGTPAAISTLNRLIVKYIFHVGGQTGT
ncbi:MAG: hypothetical protein M3R51_06805 [Candidatus Eremiobacteraeota bacterium]|nr:hypothetical protein [Candidatus Eremiobacteraeota bacterium]